MLDSIEPIIESFQYLVVWSVGKLTALFGIDSLLIALASYELAMLIFFITKRQILQRHLGEYSFMMEDEDLEVIEELEEAYNERSSVFWRHTVFGNDNSDVRRVVGDLYHLDGEHWAIDWQPKMRHRDKEKLAIAQRMENLWSLDIFEGYSDSDYEIFLECETFDIEIFNNHHSITIQGENKEITEQSANFPVDVLEMIQIRIDEVNSSLIES